MTKFNALLVYVVTIILDISLFESTAKAGLAQRDEPMTIVLNSSDYPSDEIKYDQENNNFTDTPNDESFVNDASVTTTPEENIMRSATESPSVPPVNDDHSTKSTTKTMTMNTKTMTSTTNSTTVTSISTLTTMSLTTTTVLTISSTSTISGTRH